MSTLISQNAKQVHHGLAAALFISALVLSGCDLLKVENPNSLIEEDLDNPAAAEALANGAEATVTDALGTLLAPYSTATDELTWIGTRDAWEQLDQGEINDPINEFADGAFQAASEARWTADSAIDRLESFRRDGKLQSELPLIRSYYYAGIIYLSVSEVFDNFVISDRQDAAPPVGKQNIQQLHDQAITYLSNGLELVEEGSEWQARLLALRARAYFTRTLWEKVNPVITADPLVQNARAVEDAEAALAILGTGSDWKDQLETTPETNANNTAYQVNERLELRFGNAYIQPTENGKAVAQVTLEDPIDGVPQPYLVSTINEFAEENQYADVTVISARELQLIIAEDALARNNTQRFNEAMNALRRLDELSDYTGQVPARELLEHSRRVHLFLQGRRLADQYRFGASSPEWTANRITKGSFFPITITEIRSNPHIDF